MDLEDKCVQLREKIQVEQDYWRGKKVEAVRNGQDFLATDAHGRICALANVLRVMHNLGIAVEK